MTSWWRDALNPQGLSQGDIIEKAPVAVSKVPPVSLIRTTGKKGIEIWQSGDADAELKSFLFTGNIFPVVVLSHSCDLDKKEKKAKVIVAPIRTINSLIDQVRDTVMKQSRRALMPLPEIPTLGTYYADLRMMAFIDRKLTEQKRIASMTDMGGRRLQAQLVAFFTRLDATKPLLRDFEDIDHSGPRE